MSLGFAKGNAETSILSVIDEGTYILHLLADYDIDTNVKSQIFANWLISKHAILVALAYGPEYLTQDCLTVQHG